MNQTHQNFVVFVITENFSENVREVVEEFGERVCYLWGYRKSAKLRKADSSAHWMSGYAPGLNMALKKVESQFIARLDDDDEWFPTHLENSINHLFSTGAEFVSSGALDAAENLQPEFMLSDEYYGEEYSWARLRIIVGTSITWVYRSHLRFLKFDENSWQKAHNKPSDIDYSLRLAAMGTKMTYLERPSGRAIARPGAHGLTGLKAFTHEGTSSYE